MERGKGALQKMPEFLASSLDAAVVANAKITKISSQPLVALKQAPLHLRQALDSLLERGSAIEKPREGRRERENDLRELLASSVDAVVVTNLDRRFVAASPITLRLFGVSETNITQFTIDASLLEGEILHLDGNGLPFIGREETQGACKFRLRTGNLRIADYIFVSDFVPFLHLFIFRNAYEWLPRGRAAAAG